MSDDESITVADVSAGPGGRDADPGTTVDLPVVELLTGRGLITGKSGSGKSNTASVIIEKLLSNGFPALVVDTDGEYYGLKEEFELLHAGADDECDIRVTPEHAGKIAELALEGNVPIILDVSGYLDGDVAAELVRETARHLFAKEKKLKKPFLMLVEECHEYIPEGGGLDETGRMLVKVGKRGRKHGLGIVGISQRPANVKKDFITQCDWLVWHRLTWENDTKVVRRIIDSEHADAVEDLDDGEAFLMTDWSESVRRVQFRRKRTFDAGATPGLDDVERPDLKSVSDDLVDELREISAERERRESELADLRTELEEREARIRELERELEQARDLEQMADRFSQALLRRAEAPYRGADVDESNRDDAADEDDRTVDAADDGELVDTEAESAAGADGGSIDQRPPLADVAPWPEPSTVDGASEDEDNDAGGDAPSPREWARDARSTNGIGRGGRGEEAERASDGDVGPDATTGAETDDGTETVSDADDGTERGPDAHDGTEPTPDADDGTERGPDAHGGADPTGDRATAPTEATADRTDDGGRAEADHGSEISPDDAAVWALPEEDDLASADTNTDAVGTRRRTRDRLVDDLVDRIQGLEDVTRRMLWEYRAEGPVEPVAAHLAAGGDADREIAYSRTRSLRTAGLVCHAERGTYDYALADLVEEEGGDRLRDPDLDEVVRSVEASFEVPAATDDGDESGDEPVDAIEPDEADDVEFVPDEGSGSPAFREEDAEFVDEAEPVGEGEGQEGDHEDGVEGDDHARSREAGGDGHGDGTAEEAVVLEETTSPSDGLVDRSEDARDAEFVD